MELGKKLKELRMQHQLSQEGVAKELFVTRQTVSNWERGKSYPDLEALVMIATLFQVSVDDLLKGDAQTVKKIAKKVSLKMKMLLIGLVVIAGIAMSMVVTNNFATFIYFTEIKDNGWTEKVIVKKSFFGKGNTLYLHLLSNKGNMQVIELDKHENSTVYVAVVKGRIEPIFVTEVQVGGNTISTTYDGFFDDDVESVQVYPIPEY